MRYLEDYDIYYLLAKKRENKLLLKKSNKKIISREYSKFLMLNNIKYQQYNNDFCLFKDPYSNYSMREILQYIFKYSRNNDLVNHEKNKEIRLNKELSNLFKLNENSTITFMDLVKFICIYLFCKNDTNLEKENIKIKIEKEINANMLNLMGTGFEPIKNRLNSNLTKYYFENPKNLCEILRKSE